MATFIAESAGPGNDRNQFPLNDRACFLQSSVLLVPVRTDKDAVIGFTFLRFGVGHRNGDRL